MVQGVGFRYTAQRLAGRYPITGWVRNLPTGQVEVVAEGEEKTLQEFLKVVKENFSSYIRNADVEWKPASGQFKNFKVEF